MSVSTYLPLFANRLSVQQESEQVWTRNRPTDTHTMVSLTSFVKGRTSLSAALEHNGFR